MNLVDDISRMLIWLIRAGLTFRVLYCCFRLIMADEEANTYKTRLKNSLIFAVIIELVWIIKSLVISYF
jgi:hypothetical protein